MLIALDDHDPRPAYLQIAAAVKDHVRRGAIRPGDELPSVRELAAELGIHLHTARHAYQVLQQDGVIYLRLGRRARVAPLRSAPAAAAEIETRIVARLREVVADAFHLGVHPKQLRALLDEALRDRNPGGKMP